MAKVKIFAKSILIPVIVGLFVGLIISKSIDYNSLNKPDLAPPAILFPIVWTILYILMGISYGFLESEKLLDSKVNLIYYIQLFVNALWPIFFFVLKLRLLSFIWIIFFTVLVLIMIYIFIRKNKWAGLLQITYLAWTIFATYLNWFSYVLNK